MGRRWASVNFLACGGMTVERSLPRLCRLRLASVRSRRLPGTNLHFAARLQFVLAVRHHCLAGLQARRQSSEIAFRESDGDLLMSAVLFFFTSSKRCTFTN